MPWSSRPLDTSADRSRLRVPVLHREAGFTFRFFASDRPEPPHVHVVGHGGRAKIWLARPIEIATSRGYDERELNAILRIAREHRDEWLSAWNEFFRD